MAIKSFWVDIDELDGVSLDPSEIERVLSEALSGFDVRESIVEYVGEAEEGETLDTSKRLNWYGDDDDDGDGC